MRLVSIGLVDFRNYHRVTFEPAPGLTAIVGSNGEGKTNLIEAIGCLATLSSFRGSPTEALVRSGSETAIVRAMIDQDLQVGAEGHHRIVEIEAELRPSGRDRVLVNRQVLKRTRDLLGSVRVTIFSPEDLRLVKAGPGERRAYLDGVLVSLTPSHDALMSDLERVLRQRNTLLKQAGGRLSPEIEATLDVWDAKLCVLGEKVADVRGALVERLNPLVGETYDQVADGSTVVNLRYESPWREIGLARALVEARKDDLRRGVTTVGPHRDEMVILLDDHLARTHGSQGEQRSLALALRLASHHLVHQETRTTPILLLDDVFSELDPNRSAALLANLPPGQALLTTTEDLPSGARPERVINVRAGQILNPIEGGR